MSQLFSVQDNLSSFHIIPNLPTPKVANRRFATSAISRNLLLLIFAESASGIVQREVMNIRIVAELQPYAHYGSL